MNCFSVYDRDGFSVFLKDGLKTAQNMARKCRADIGTAVTVDPQAIEGSHFCIYCKCLRLGPSFRDARE